MLAVGANVADKLFTLSSRKIGESILRKHTVIPVPVVHLINFDFMPTTAERALERNANFLVIDLHFDYLLFLISVFIIAYLLDAVKSFL
jgi:hypothetical protein